MNCQEETPSKSTNRLNRIKQGSSNCDSPFTSMPKFSTPPSRFMKILNPFEQHLIERLHLPTYSPNMFVQTNPKTDKFKWSIDDISTIQPADIDESSIRQHVNDLDPHVDSIAQEKIDRYFSEKVVLPSPSPVRIQTLPLTPKHIQTNNCSTQTCLSLPPNLPKHIEDVLKPYFHTEIEVDNADPNSSLYRKLFMGSPNQINSVESSPALSTGLSPIELSPVFCGLSRHSTSPINDLLKDCPLSPVFDRTENMSVDVPDIRTQLNYTDCDESNATAPMQSILSNDTSTHWDVEYKHVSILSKSPPDNVPELLNTSSSNTPHSKLFTSQRKRLSESFRDDTIGRDIEMDEHDTKKFKNSTIDGGYHTGEGSSTWNSMHVFASTPTKNKN